MRKPIVAAMCVAAAVSLAGCGGTAGGPSGAAAPATFTAAPELVDAVIAATKDKGSAKLAFNFGLGNQSITGTGAYAGTGADTKLQMALQAAGQGNIELVLLDQSIYVKVPGAPGGKPWIKSGLTGELGKQFASLGDQADLSKQFGLLKDGGTVTGSAPDTVDGKQATKYTLAIDTAKLAAAGSESVKSGMKALNDQGIKTFDEQLWVDGANLPLRVSTSIPVQGQTTTFDTKYSDWGVPVAITAPPADQVTDAPS